MSNQLFTGSLNRTPGSPPPTGNDIEDALSIIGENGGVGEWEADNSKPVDRWLFPRFTPKCLHCGEKMTQDDNGSWDCAVKSTKAAPHTTGYDMDPGDMYLSRSGLGQYDTDVETIAAWLDAPRNRVGGIMLLGEPGTGKSALAQAACVQAGREIEFITATPDDTRDSLFLRFVGEGHGEGGTPFVMGALPLAVKYGRTLVVDEYMLWVDGLKPVSYNLMDGSHYLPGGNVDGSALEVHPDFRIIITSNPQVRGASLPEPIGSRLASTTITIETSASMLRDLAIDDSVVAAWEALGTAGLWRPQIREMRAADYWLATDPAQAVSAFLPEHAPESERDQIRATVVSYIGGNIRNDGRLVVK